MLKKNNQDIPEKTGIYLFKSKRKILYIGKAKNLNKRIKQYFREQDNRVINNLLNRSEDIEFIITDDEKDALHLEYNLIHTYQPPFNIKLKDDKSFPFIEITTGHRFPGIYFSRQVDEKNFYVGPITNSKKTKELIDIVTRLFKIRICSDNYFKRATPCLYFHLDRCLAPCRQESVGKEIYKKNAVDAIDFLKGKKDKVLEKLKKNMTRCAAELKFEAAQKIKEDIDLIETFNIESYISSTRITDYDVTAIYTERSATAANRARQTHFVNKKSSQKNKIFDNSSVEDQDDCIVILFSIVNGRVKRREIFNFNALNLKKEELLKTFLISFYRKGNIPREILVPFYPVENEAIEELFSRLAKRKVSIKIPVKGDKKKMLDLVQKNLNLYINQNKYSDLARGVKEKLKLKHLPDEIEGIDISHFAERERVGAVVSFSHGKAVKKKYRNYIIKEAESGDTAAIKEVLARRFKKREKHPDLLVIDGGRAQLHAAREIKDKFKIKSDIVSIAKREERIYLEAGGSVIFPRGSAERFLFQNIRDEAHRRAITHHKSRREKI